MAITGPFNFNGLKADAAYAVISAMDIRTGSAFVTFSIYASVENYELGNPPLVSFPMSIEYDGTTVPVDTFEEAAIASANFAGFTRTATVVKPVTTPDRVDPGLFGSSNLKSV